MPPFVFPFVLAVLVAVQAGLFYSTPRALTFAGLVLIALLWIGSLVLAAVSTLEEGRNRRGMMIERRRALAQAERAEALQRMMHSDN